MGRSPVDAEFGTDPVTACPSCGQLNRVRLQQKAGRFRCGQCRAVLGANPEMSVRNDPAGQMFNRANAAVAVALIIGAALAYLAFTGHESLPDSAIGAGRIPVPAVERARAPGPERRLPQSIVVQESTFRGNGTLTVSNGSAMDAYVKLMHPSLKILITAFYVRAGTDFSVQGIPDGEFALRFALGRDWDESAHRFTRDQRFSQFARPLNYVTRETRTAEAVHWEYPVYEITLHPVPAGNAPTHGISEAEFDGR